MDERRKRLLVETTINAAMRVRTKAVDVSFGELLNMHSTQELLLCPDAASRWSDCAQSMFIESLLLDFLIPPIYTAETDIGVYEIIDGNQRIISYLRAWGAYNHLPLLVLQGCEIITELNGLTAYELPKTLQNRVKRRHIRMEIVQRDTEKELRERAFKRLADSPELQH